MRPFKLLSLLFAILGVGLIAPQGALRAETGGGQEQSMAGNTETGDTKGGPLMPNGLSRIRFERSGGLVHLTISGSVSFHDDHAEAAADTAGDHRQLAEDELNVFKRLDLDALGSSQFSAEGADASGQISPGQPDRYQYDVVLETRSGRSVVLRFGEQPASALDSAASGLGDLALWVRREVEAIWKKKAGLKQ